MPAAYYMSLCAVKDLVSLHTIAGVERFGNKQFLAIIDGRDPPAMADPTAVAIEDGAIEADDDAALGDAGPVASGGAATASAVVPIALPAVAVVGAPDAGAHLRPVHWNGFVVRYDRWSHSSGILRCYVACGNPDHHKCCRWMQENQCPSRREVVASLFAWAELGRSTGMSRGEHQLRDTTPSGVRVREIMRELPPGV